MRMNDAERITVTVASIESMRSRAEACSLRAAAVASADSSVVAMRR
jgi:hypothetical protein